MDCIPINSQHNVEEITPLESTSSSIPSNKGLGPLLDSATNPTKTTIHQITLLSWVTPQEVREYQKKIEDQLQSQFMSEKEEKWKSHDLYCNNTKAELEVLCRNCRINSSKTPVSFS